MVCARDIPELAHCIIITVYIARATSRDRALYCYYSMYGALNAGAPYLINFDGSRNRCGIYRTPLRFNRREMRTLRRRHYAVGKSHQAFRLTREFAPATRQSSATARESTSATHEFAPKLSPSPKTGVNKH